MSGWGCVHQIDEKCERMGGRPCDPGMPGCILAGRFRFSNPAKNRPRPAEPPARPDAAQSEPQPPSTRED